MPRHKKGKNMKRINLKIDLDENSMFDKEIEDAIKAKVREVTRQEIATVIAEESKKEVERLILGNTHITNEMQQIINSNIHYTIRDAVHDVERATDINAMAQQEMEKHIAAIISNLDEKCEKAVEDAVTAKMQTMLHLMFSQKKCDGSDAENQ